ncbi:MAG: bi-functional transferase/deacetylase [candidate division WS6 bacterium 34_10]|jgi:cellulose synthase/poly-beta-1,6-N-acetylglucosamine synthase-like glycosyltransferase|uniref:Bi-functional transferase/deacetylase n=1 Tax=candidate division WS6 bacterium 34_10 TaxID=1641389 RepID=A0A101HIN8_9BACT|nr:MAG: bi-functional transferase/deacetylase [candidate division WS6 bacterium 34_10]
MLSVIITSFKEPKTIGKCIESIVDAKYSGISKPFEVLQVSPDKETLRAGKITAKKLGLSGSEYRQIEDPCKGKPFALKMALEKAKGDIIILTDGDTYFDKNAVKELLKPFKNKKIGGVSGRPVASDSKDSQMGYYGNLLADSAHHRRSTVMKPVQNGNYYISDKEFFPMSGYIMAIRNMKFNIPKDVLSDDAYISYVLRNRGYEIGYAPKARCFVKYPKSLKDYFKQKVRSIGGFIQLEQYGIFKRDKQSRSFLIELKYFLYVLKYPNNIKQMFWSILFFPIRLWTWIRIFWERRVVKKDFKKTWVRVESTK